MMLKKILIVIITTAVLFGCNRTKQQVRDVWTKEQANEWYKQWDWLRGCDFIPSSAINQLEMWQVETFDTATIDRELGWAENIGMNCMRVYLHHLAWQIDENGFKNRMKTYLDIAQKHGISTIFVFFDDCWNPAYAAGKQPEPQRGIHNSGWVRDPGDLIFQDSLLIDTLEMYVKDVLKTFKDDKRIVLWDLYNEPGNSGYDNKSMPLLEKVFLWARTVNPSQPLSAGVWRKTLAELTRFQLENSDVITYHNYSELDNHRQAIDSLKNFGRPLICTEYMARRNNSTFQDIMPLLKSENIGAINWGLVSGKTNTIFAWDTPMPDVTEPPLWFHDIFRKDGTPFSEEEIAFIKELTGNKLYTNPLLPVGPDPWALWHDGAYYYMNTLQDSLVLWVTPDVTDLKHAQKKTIWIPQDPANAKNLWAPEIHFINGKWYVYYAADDGNTDNHQLYVLENENKNPLEGDFVMRGRISTDPDNNWAIDGSVFEYQGDWYLVWSGWQTRRVDTETQCIYIARMENPWTLSSERVLISKPELEWERKYQNEDNKQPRYIVYVNEGPQPLKSPNGKYIHIVYSASGCWTPYYALGLLTAENGADLLNPASWKKSPQSIFKQSPENKVFGTGHNSFFKSPDGTEDYILYHARDTKTDPPGAGDTRSPRAQKIEWDDRDYPVMGIPLPITKALKKPAGTLYK